MGEIHNQFMAPKCWSRLTLQRSMMESVACASWCWIVQDKIKYETGFWISLAVGWKYFHKNSTSLSTCAPILGGSKYSNSSCWHGSPVHDGPENSDPSLLTQLSCVPMVAPVIAWMPTWAPILVCTNPYFQEFQLQILTWASYTTYTYSHVF